MNRAALFDIDGTLADTNHLHVTCWWEALRQAGRDVAMREIHRAIGLLLRELERRVWRVVLVSSAQEAEPAALRRAVDATRAGVTGGGLLCGGIPRNDLEEAGARAIYRDPADLLSRLDDSPFALPPAAGQEPEP
ncbi:HAD family hydrolase [Streptomyces sp. NPDC057686]|uniref:HAD family hydrolase n=1 Tax=Streptomyces sp. NPDC057686 TaxID=3346212 RepID=UPI00368B740B